MSKSSPDSQNIPLKEDYLPFLDGLRGLAAVWVIAFHSLILSGSRLPVLSQGLVAVKLFMIMSGFLMAYHYYLRQEKEPWEAPGSWLKFYIRRFFRIVPLYYFLFLVYFLLGPTMGEWRQGIAHYYDSAISPASRYNDQSFTNVWMHLSFLFGMSPEYSFRTPMPDWSIGLEMQFYVVFPLLMLLFRGYYFAVTAVVLHLGCRIINKVFIKDAFYLPSFLPLAMDYFLIGMLLAVYNRYRDDRIKAPLAAGVALVLAWRSHEILIFLIAILILLLLNPRSVGKPVKLIAQALGCRWARWLADMSYCAYLLHLAFMTPIAYFCTRWDGYLHMLGRFRFLVVFLLTVIPTYVLSMVLFHWIEKNGILWGKRIVKKL